MDRIKMKTKVKKIEEKMDELLQLALKKKVRNTLDAEELLSIIGSITGLMSIGAHYDMKQNEN